MSNKLLFPLILGAMAFSLSLNAHACTAFAANGKDFVEGGGTLITKVRDQIMTKQTVKAVYPEKGYAYFGLFNGKKEFFNMGINEKGFVVFSTTAGSIPKKARESVKTFRSPEGLTGLAYMMQNCASVQEAIAHGEIFRHRPTNYVMADAKQIAFVEVLPDGTHQVTVKDNGMLTHTNHYLLDGSLPFNKKISESSQSRLDRIRSLMKEHKKPFTMDDFIGFTQDQHAGLDNSIYRLGSKENGPSTLSTMVVHIPEKGAPKMYLKWRDKKNVRESWQMLRQEILFDHKKGI